MDTPKDPLPLPPVPCSALDEQRNALAEARLRIIARYEHVETWLKQPATEQTLANWAGMVEGLRQARQIIGAMWDELPVPKPQAVIDHEAHMRRVIEEQNAQGDSQSPAKRHRNQNRRDGAAFACSDLLADYDRHSTIQMGARSTENSRILRG
jgi:hypothetical protein